MLLGMVQKGESSRKQREKKKMRQKKENWKRIGIVGRTYDRKPQIIF